MKIFLYFILFSLSFISLGAELNVQSRIEQNKFYRESFPAIYGTENISNIQLFKKEIKRLNASNRASVDLLIKELSPILPSEFLRPIIYWKIVSPNESNLIQSIVFTMLYKANVLRDNFQSPVIEKESRLAIKNLILKTYLREDLDENNFYSSLMKDFNQKAKIIIKFNNIQNFILAVKETRPLAFTLHKDEGITPYSLSFLGHIPGNQIRLVSENIADQERINWYIERFSSHEKDGPHLALKTDPIFISAEEMILRAKESIFVCIKIIDGTLGRYFSKSIIEHTEKKIRKNPDFKVYVLVDENSPSLDIFNQRLNSMAHLKNNVFIIQKPKSLKMNNSKLIVIDANSKKPEALIGTKNWSDHSGGYFFDNNIWVKGPAAALLQNSFYNDLSAFLSDSLVNSGLKNQREKILESFKISRKNYPYLGDQSIRITESDLDATIKNTRNIVIDMISRATSHIYMEQLYLYDTYVINALVKRKLKLPLLDIRIIADNNSNIGLNGLPNSIYLRELKLYKIPVKSRRTISTTKTLPNGNIQSFIQENHRNIISVDGKILLIGSAPLAPSYLQGDTREIGIQIFDKNSISKFENDFLVSWNHRSKVMDLDIENFRAKVNNSSLSKDISSLINAIASTLIKAKDELKDKF